VAYTANNKGFPQPKCEFCDDERRITYTAANGSILLKQRCDCDGYKYHYTPEEVMLQKINFFKTDWHKGEFTATAKYSPKMFDEGKNFNVNITFMIEKFTEDTQNIIDSTGYNRHAVFTTFEECQKYCDWKNIQKTQE